MNSSKLAVLCKLRMILRSRGYIFYGGACFSTRRRLRFITGHIISSPNGIPRTGSYWTLWNLRDFENVRECDGATYWGIGLKYRSITYPAHSKPYNIISFGGGIFGTYRLTGLRIRWYVPTQTSIQILGIQGLSHSADDRWTEKAEYQ